jgi:hypothetical protein
MPARRRSFSTVRQAATAAALAKILCAAKDFRGNNRLVSARIV